MIYNSNFTTTEIRATIAATEDFEDFFQRATKEAYALFQNKGEKQDIREPFWHRMPFGDASWATQVAIKSSRAVSAVVRADGPYLDEELDDLIVYALAWKAWRRLRAGRLLVRLQEEGG